MQTKKDFITCSKLIINEIGGSPIRSDNVYFTNSEQISLVLFITRDEHNLIKLKVGLWSSKTIYIICLIESPLTFMKNAFYFILKTFFFLNMFKFLSRLFGPVGKTAWLEGQV